MLRLYKMYVWLRIRLRDWWKPSYIKRYWILIVLGISALLLGVVFIWGILFSFKGYPVLNSRYGDESVISSVKQRGAEDNLFYAEWQIEQLVSDMVSVRSQSQWFELYGKWGISEGVLEGYYPLKRLEGYTIQEHKLYDVRYNLEGDFQKVYVGVAYTIVDKTGVTLRNYNVEFEVQINGQGKIVNIKERK